jgi:hypothetical protein
MLVYLITFALANITTYLLAYNKGFDDGEKIGQIDMMFKEKGITILHNGVPQ